MRRPRWPACWPLCFLWPLLGRAQIFKMGPCPNVTSQEDLQLKQLEGAWFEVERSFSLTQLGHKCVTFRFHSAAEGKVQLLQSSIDMAGQIRNVTGEIRVRGPHKDQEALATDLEILMEGGAPLAWPSAVPYNVLVTDYETYLLVNICINVGVVHSENTWLLSRDPALEPATVRLLHCLLDSSGFTAEDLRATEQSCWTRRLSSGARD